MELCHSTSLHTYLSNCLLILNSSFYEFSLTKEPGNFVATCDVNVLKKSLQIQLHYCIPLLGFIGASRNSTNEKAKTSKAFI